MKPLEEYTTWKQIENALQKDGFAYVDGSNAYNTRYDADVDYKNISFEADQAAFSCAIPEWGMFESTDSAKKFWPYLFKYNLLKFYKQGKFIRCSVSERQKHAAEIEDGLLANNFIPVGEVKSKHGRYKVHMWEWYGFQ